MFTKIIGCIALLLSTLILAPDHSEAKRYRNSYLSFELPQKWKCSTEGTDTVCFNQLTKKKEAVIVFTAKEAGPADSFESFKDYLKQPHTIPNSKKVPTPSKVLYVKDYRIQGKQWVDGLHLGSEMENFYTRYLATISNGLAISITFTAHRAYYTKFSQDFKRAVDSLLIVASKGGLAANGLRPGGKPLNQPQGTFGSSPGVGGGMVNLEDDGLQFQNQQGMSTKRKMALALIVLAAIGFAYYFLKMRKK